ncbi:MAG: FAD-binding oxidoreductase [Fimbriimonadaceae bacterium]|nr:FAD-binding oxidoreductase [Fimbriimonadaceae bacterium]
MSDITVLGAGIVGAACAHYLAEAGLRVTVVDRRPPGLGATGAGMGHLVAMDDSDAQLALTSASLALWEDLLPGLDCEDDRCGTIWIAADDEEMAACASKRDEYAKFGLRAEVLDADGLYEAEPLLRPGLTGGLWVPGDRVIYAPKACVELLQHPRISFVCREVFELPAGPVVVALGAWSPDLISDLPIRPRKGHLMITDRYPGLISHQLVELGYLKSAHGGSDSSVAFNLQPRTTGQIIIGSSREFVGWDAAIRKDVINQMVNSAIEMVPAMANTQVIRTWVGFRPATTDHLPLIGKWEENVWVAAGHEGLGITTASATGRLIAELVHGRTPFLDPKPFDPRREVMAHA